MVLSCCLVFHASIFIMYLNKNNILKNKVIKLNGVYDSGRVFDMLM